MGTLPVKGGKASKSGILTGFATTCALFAGLYGEPAMALADDVARACPAECWLNPVKLICDMFNRLYFFEDLGPLPFARARGPHGPGVCRRRHADLWKEPL